MVRRVSLCFYALIIFTQFDIVKCIAKIFFRIIQFACASFYKIAVKYSKISLFSHVFPISRFLKFFSLQFL